MKFEWEIRNSRVRGREWQRRMCSQNERTSWPAPVWPLHACDKITAHVSLPAMDWASMDWRMFGPVNHTDRGSQHLVIAPSITNLHSPLFYGMRWSSHWFSDKQPVLQSVFCLFFFFFFWEEVPCVRMNKFWGLQRDLTNQTKESKRKPTKS